MEVSERTQREYLAGIGYQGEALEAAMEGWRRIMSGEDGDEGSEDDEL